MTRFNASTISAKESDTPHPIVSPKAHPLVFVTGFEPFAGAAVNPSGEIALLLNSAPPAGVRVAGTVLPVSYTHAPPAFESALTAVREQSPVAILSLGVQSATWFRLESRAAARLVDEDNIPDAEGAFAAEQPKLGVSDLATDLDLEALRQSLLRGGSKDARISDDAGGYLCNVAYYLGLRAGKELGIPALFLHVPEVETVDVETQASIIRPMITELVRQANAPGRSVELEPSTRDP